MKRTLCILALPLFAGCGQPSSTSQLAASGPDLVCRAQATADTGYLTRFLGGGQSYSRADLSTVDFAGEHPLATMTSPVLLQAPPTPDQPQDVLMFAAAAAPGGYSVSLTSGDFAGRRYSRVRQKTAAGTVQLAELLCLAQTH